jgi:hypothetical protein
MTTTTDATRRHFYAVNKVATRGNYFACEAWGHVRHFTWTGDTPRDVLNMRAGNPADWGGQCLAAKDYAVIYDGAGAPPSEAEILALRINARKATQ